MPSPNLYIVKPSGLAVLTQSIRTYYTSFQKEKNLSIATTGTLARADLTLIDKQGKSLYKSTAGTFQEKNFKFHCEQLLVQAFGNCAHPRYQNLLFICNQKILDKISSELNDQLVGANLVATDQSADSDVTKIRIRVCEKKIQIISDRTFAWSITEIGEKKLDAGALLSLKNTPLVFSQVLELSDNGDANIHLNCIHASIEKENFDKFTKTIKINPNERKFFITETMQLTASKKFSSSFGQLNDALLPAISKQQPNSESSQKNEIPDKQKTNKGFFGFIRNIFQSKPKENKTTAEAAKSTSKKPTSSFFIRPISSFMNYFCGKSSKVKQKPQSCAYSIFGKYNTGDDIKPEEQDSLNKKVFF